MPGYLFILFALLRRPNKAKRSPHTEAIYSFPMEIQSAVGPELISKVEVSNSGINTFRSVWGRWLLDQVMVVFRRTNDVAIF